MKMIWWSRGVFGQVEFPEREEFREFQFKFLILLQIFGASTSALFLWLVAIGASPRFSELHMQVMTGHAILMTAFWLALRGRKHWFLPVAWLTLVVSMADLLSAFVFVDNDESRTLWLLANIPAAYLVLGRRVGGGVSLLSIAAIILVNPHVTLPLSPNAVATTVMAMLYFAVFFHAYAKQSIYFFLRMRESNERLREMATRDVLTGSLNARAYYEICDSMISLAQRNGTPYSVLFIDLDHFKSINDTWGHAAGDVVLKAVADCLARNMRASDAMGRIGGEEFSVFLPNTDVAGATVLAETIRKSIENLMPSIGDRELKITASIGVARNHHSDQSMLEIQKLADQAMYRAKAAGRNRVSAVDDADVVTA